MSVSNLVEKFRSVALDRIERLNTLLVELERDGSNEERVQTLLREIHTLKGEAKMMGFADVNLVAHLTEHLLLGADKAHFDVSRAYLELTFSGLDILRSLLTKAAGSSDAPIDLAGFVDAVAVARFNADSVEAAPGKASSDVSREAESGEFRSVELDASASTGNLLRIQSGGSVRVEMSRLERLGETSGEMLLMTRRVDYRRSRLESLHDELIDEVNRASPNLPKTQSNALRAVTHRLESALKDMREEVYLGSLRASQVDEDVRGLRHVPLAQVLSHYPRAVRDLALSQGKHVRLVHRFGDVQVDRVILSGLSDPLLHLIRNAVDHGIESPEERLAGDKDKEGEIKLIAEYAGDSIVVELSDDGRGMDADKLRKRAVERGFLSEEKAESMRDAQALELIFEKGFSTRDKVSDVSGRGLGMDIVRREISQLNGSVEIASTPGVGTTFRLTLPVSSAVSSILMIVIGTRRFAVAAKDIERVDVVEYGEVLRGAAGGHVIKHGQEMIALVDGAAQLGLEAHPLAETSLTVLVLRRQERYVAVRIDDVIGERDAMTRPLGMFLSGIRMCRGVALTDAGEVVPLLNVGEMLAATATGSRSMTRVSRPKPRPETRGGRILVVEDSEITRSLVVGILSGLGHEIVEAEDGVDAWSKLQRFDIDLILTDVQMPRMSGLELLERVRSDRRFSEVAVVVLTTLSSSEDRERAMALGANGYLAKLDFEEKDLLRSVRRYLGEVDKMR